MFIFSDLNETVHRIEFKKVKISELTTIATEGEVWAAFPRTLDSALEVIARQECLVLGYGSNVLLPPGLELPVVSLRYLKGVKFLGDRVLALAGTNLSYFINELARRGYSGLEGLIGFPSTVGGAAWVGAGRGNVNFAEFVSKVVLASPLIEEKNIDEVNFGYRRGLSEVFDGVILAVYLSLNSFSRGDYEVIKERIFEAAQVRRKQPTLPSAGCFYKNPRKNLSAGYLIDKAGLKGIKVGGAAVSIVHANFFVNTGRATYKDFVELDYVVRERVLQRFGIALEREVRIYDNYGQILN